MQPIDHFILQRILEREQRKKELREGLRIPLPVPGLPHESPLEEKEYTPKKPIIIDMT
jgi:hypothetical protein